MNNRTFTSGALLAAVVLASGAAQAAGSMTGDVFDLSVGVDDSTGGVTVSGPFSGTAAGVADNYFSNADLVAGFSVDGTEYDVRVNWVDGDSVDIFFNAFGAVSLSQLSITLSNLNFKSGGTPAAITGASFNRAASNVDEFFAGPGMPSPSVTFTGSSMTAAFGFMPGDLAADGPVLRFDLTTAVPEPATYAMLLGGLGLIGLARRRAVKRGG